MIHQFTVLPCQAFNNVMFLNYEKRNFQCMLFSYLYSTFSNTNNLTMRSTDVFLLTLCKWNIFNYQTRAYKIVKQFLNLHNVGLQVI